MQTVSTSAGTQARGDQRADRHLAARRERVDDHVVARRHERADERGVGRHVDRVVGVVALLLHHRDHHRAHGRHVGHRRARTRRRTACRRPRWTCPARRGCGPTMLLRRPHDLVGDAAVQHQLAAEDEERDGEEREDVHPGHHLLEEDGDRQTLVEDGAQGRQPDREGDRHARARAARRTRRPRMVSAMPAPPPRPRAAR